MNARTLVGLLACVTALAGCEDKKKAAPQAEPSKAEPAKVEPKAEPAAPPLAFKDLERLGLKVEVPGGCTVEDTSPDGPPRYSVYDPAGDFNLMVHQTGELDARTLEAQKKELALDPNKVKRFTREEQGADGGWVLEWEAVNMMEPGKLLYGVRVFKQVAGKGVSCARNVDRKATADAISRACQSLAAR